MDTHDRAQSNSRTRTRELLVALRTILAGGGSSGPAARVREAALRAAAEEFLAIVRAAFLVKSDGGTDEAGVTWAPLSPTTVAYKKQGAALDGARSAAKQAGRTGRPLLTDAQDRVWRAVYASSLARARQGGAGGAEASAQAAGSAWAVVKALGGKTILGEYGGRKVAIGRDSGRLLASLSPESPDCLVGLSGATVEVGSRVEYAEFFHRRRPIWPDELPPAWVDRIVIAAAQAAARALAQELGVGR